MNRRVTTLFVHERNTTNYLFQRDWNKKAERALWREKRKIKKIKITYFRNNSSVFFNNMTTVFGVTEQHFKEAYRQYGSTLHRILDYGTRRRRTSCTFPSCVRACICGCVGKGACLNMVTKSWLQPENKPHSSRLLLHWNLMKQPEQLYSSTKKEYAAHPYSLFTQWLNSTRQKWRPSVTTHFQYDVMNQGIAHAVRSTSQIEAFKLVGKRTCSIYGYSDCRRKRCDTLMTYMTASNTSLQKSGAESHNKAKIIGTIRTEIEVECCCWINNNNNNNYYYYYYYVTTWFNQKCGIRKFPGQSNFLEGQQLIFEYNICPRLKMVWYSSSVTGKFYHVNLIKNFQNLIWGCKDVVTVVTQQWQSCHSSLCNASPHYRRKIHTPFVPFTCAGQLQVL